MDDSPPRFTCTLISPTSWGGNCFELVSANTQPSQWLPLVPWNWIGVSQLALGTLSPGRLQLTLAAGLLPSSACWRQQQEDRLGPGRMREGL
jgi:hypothetical protein